MLTWVFRSLAGVLLVFSLVVSLTSLPAQAAGKGEPGPVTATRVELRSPAADVKLFQRMGLDLDGVFDGWARIHLLPEEARKLAELGYSMSALPVDPGLLEAPAPAAPPEPGRASIPAAYHTYDSLTTELQGIAAANPDLVSLASIGQTVQGRELWMVQISDNPGVEEDEPAVVYFAAMHGDEVVGKELCIGLINYLINRYGTDARVTNLVDDTEIWILPSLNPDGTELGQRYNANGYDINRNFPDWFSDPVNTPVGRQPETQAVMAWVAQHAIVLGGVFHGGALVVNYPFDNNPTGSQIPSPTPDPDDPAFYSISLTYAENNPPMYASSSFPYGVTNGADWYVITGGLQDWSYTWYGNFTTTLEIGNVKWPSASTLPAYWDDNLESMLAYLERTHEGVRGLVTDQATGAPVAAEIRLDSDPFAVYTDPDVGDYHRVVLPGSYTLEVSAAGYFPQSVPVTVTAGPAVRYDVQLQAVPTDLQPAGSRVEDGAAGDGVVDPDETCDLAVTLKNLGASATAVTGRLVPTGWYGNAVQADGAYPDLGNQQSAETLAPYHTIHVDPAVPAGHWVGFAVDWQADQGSGTSQPFFLNVGAGSCESSAAGDVPQSILDYQTTTSQALSPHDVLIDELHVPVQIDHSYIGDLKVSLTAPSGTRVVLHDRSGGTANEIAGTYGIDLTPVEPLTILGGEPAAGTWTLTVEDLAGGDTGSLVSWGVESCGWPAEAVTPEMRLRGLASRPEGTQIDWWPYPGLTAYKVYRATTPSSPAAFADVTAEDGDDGDTTFIDTSSDPVVYFLVTGIGVQGEGPKGHFGE